MNVLKLILIVLAFASVDVHAQSTGVVRDSLTQEPIPFVNIWVEGESDGTTANEKGEFMFKKSVAGKRLVYSSIGYKSKTKVASDSEVILLQPEAIRLKAAVVNAKKSKPKTETLGEDFKLSGVRRFFFCGESPYIAAKYFPYREEYSKTPYISALEIVTSSPLEGASFNIRLYAMNEQGEPGQPVYPENIFGKAKKGVTLTRVELADKNIEFPQAGLLVAFEFLILEDNKKIYVHKNDPDTTTIRSVVYAPAVGTVPVKTSGLSWIYYGGTWRPATLNKNVQQEEYEGKYSDVAIRLTVSN